MSINFSNTDIIFIYGTLLKDLRKIEKVENAKGNPIDDESIKSLKKPILSVLSKIEETYPQILEMKNHEF